nr:hypothetical protein [Nocardia terpenica]
MFGCRTAVVGSIGLDAALLNVFVGRPAVRLLGKIVGGGEAGIVQVREARVVDGLADRDRHRIAMGVDDDLSWPDAIDGVARDSAGCQDFGFAMAALESAVPGGVVEGGVHVDAVRVVQLVHVADLPEGAIGQPFQLPPGNEFAQMLTFPGDDMFRALRQRDETAAMVVTCLSDVRADVECIRIARCETGSEDFRSPRIHAEQRVPGIEIRVTGTVIAPHRRVPVAVILPHQLSEIDRCHRIVEGIARHGPAQVAGQFAIGTTGFEVVRFHARVAPLASPTAERVRDHVGEIALIELFGRFQRGLWSLGDVAPLVDNDCAFVNSVDHVVERHALFGGIPVDLLPIAFVQREWLFTVTRQKQRIHRIARAVECGAGIWWIAVLARR